MLKTCIARVDIKQIKCGVNEHFSDVFKINILQLARCSIIFLKKRIWARESEREIFISYNISKTQYWHNRTATVIQQTPPYHNWADVTALRILWELIRLLLNCSTYFLFKRYVLGSDVVSVMCWLLLCQILYLLVLLTQQNLFLQAYCLCFSPPTASLFFRASSQTACTVH